MRVRMYDVCMCMQVFQRLLFPISCLANTAEEAVEIIRGLEQNSSEVDSILRFSQRALEHIDVRTSPDVVGSLFQYTGHATVTEEL